MLLQFSTDECLAASAVSFNFGTKIHLDVFITGYIQYVEC
jgi:hypothetical protein